MPASRAAILLASGFEKDEFIAIHAALTQAGIGTEIVSAKKHEVRSWDNSDWDDSVKVDVALVDAQGGDYDMVIVPGGLIAADTLRQDRHAVRFVTEALAAGNRVACLSHACWLLIEAGAVAGRQVTSAEAIRSDMANAGAAWLDQSIVADGPIITGRRRHDLTDFTAGLIEALSA